MQPNVDDFFGLGFCIFLIIFSNCFEFKTIRELFRDKFFFFLLIMKNESESEPIEEVLRFKT